RVALYGSYWERFPETRPCARGHADAGQLRRVLGRAGVVLGLGRRANRDGHVMRSFEVPPIGACLLAECTEDHLGLFGKEGEAVLYFRDPDDMLAKLRRLLANDPERRRLAAAAHQRITSGGHTYRDRLATMLGLRIGPDGEAGARTRPEPIPLPPGA